VGKYRTGIEIVAAMLQAALDGARKTHLMYQCNLSYKLLRRYLETTARAHLLATKRDGRYVTTEQGRLFLAKVADYADRSKRLTQEAAALAVEKRYLEDMLKRQE
jgi:predicted transcriptional regulator